MAAIATFALKAGVWFRRGRLVIVSPDSLGTTCQLSGRNSTYRPVQISGTGSDIEEPDHAKGLIAQRSRAREQRLMMHFLALSPDATAYYVGLEQHRLNARHHVRKILALAEIYPADAVVPSPTGSPSRPSVPSTSPTSWRPAPGRCRNPDHCNSPA